jgi:hypothetical protein
MSMPPGPSGPGQPPHEQPPGWYDDPGFPGHLRWWDGRQWAPPGPPPGGFGGPGYGGPGYGGPGYGFVAPPNLPDEQRSGNRARSALWAGVGVQAVSLVCNLIYLNEAGPAMRDFWNRAMNAPRGTRVAPMTPLSSTATLANGIGQFAAFGSLIVGILFLVWFHRALTNAQSLGLPMRRSPGWGIAGFFIPIVNLWFPYQSACDLFPPGHPDRKIVGRWWACYLGAGFAAIPTFVAAFFSIAVGAAFAVLVAALYLLAAIAGREMIERAHAAHAELAGPMAAAPGPMGGGPMGGGPMGPGPMGPGSGPGFGAPVPDPWNPNPPKDPWAS